jgi:hypothetical protein
MQRIFNPERDWCSYIRGVKHLDKEFQIFANSTDPAYLIVFYNTFKLCYLTGEFNLPWVYFEKIGIPDIKSVIDEFVSNFPGKIILTEYSNPGFCRKLTIPNQKWLSDMYFSMMQFNKKKMSQRTNKQYHELYNKISEEQNIKYADSPIIEWVSYLNKINMPKWVLDNCEDALSIFNDPKEQIIIMNLIQDINAGKIYSLDSRETINYRIGGLFNNLPRQIRRFVLLPCIEIDLKSAHLSFLCAATNLNLPDDIYNLIASETGLKKDRVKECIVRTIYGGTQSPRDALIADDTRRAEHDRARASYRPTACQEQEREAYIDICLNVHFSKIKLAVEKLTSQIKNDGGIVDAFGIKLEIEIDESGNINKQILNEVIAAYYSSFEKKLLMKLLPITKKGMQILSDEHDGCSIYISNSERKEEILRMCKNAVEKEAKRMGIKTTLEIK